MPQHIVIIGAGAAGLAAAQILGNNGCRVTLLEARRRIGGRILTIDSKLRVPFELGAEFIHGRPKTTFDIVDEAGLTAYAIPFEHMARGTNNRLVDFPRYSEDLKRAMAGLSKLGKRDISFAEYLRRHRNHGITPAQRLASDFVQGFDAADPERISAKSVADEQEGLGDVDDESQFRLLEGYGSLIEHVRKSLNRERVKIRLDRVVSAIHWKKSDVEVHCRGRREVFRGSRILITLPLGVLQVPPESPESIRFIPEIPEKRRALAQLASGPIIKVILHFREPFWEKLREDLQHASFMHDPALPFPTWWTPSPVRLPFLTGWVGGPKAVMLTGLGHAALQRAAIESLSSLLNHGKKAIASVLERCHTYDWPNDPFARGAYSYVTVGGNRAREILSQPLANTLYFAGEAVDTSNNASTVAGAIHSGQCAARTLLATL